MSMTVPKIRTIREQVYEGIKTMIINGQFPQGSRLQESDLVELFQVSRTPVREALKMLRDDGLLDSGPRKGLFVKTLTPHNVKDIFEVRGLLEQFALREAIARLTQEEERHFLTLRGRFEAFRVYSDMEEYIRLDSELHDSIITCSGNQFLRELTDRVYNVLQPVRLFSLHTQERYEESISEHIGIIDGILARNLEQAASVLQLHLDEAQKGVIYLLQNQTCS